MVAVAAIELRELASGLAPALRPYYDVVKTVSKPMIEDRPLGLEIEQIADLIEQGCFEI